MRKNEAQLQGGLNSLLGGSRTGQPNTLTEQETAATTTEEQAETIESGTPEEEEDLINSIEDEELRAALHRKRMEKRGRPKKSEPQRQKEAETFTRFCAIIRRDYIAKLHEICYRETLTIKEIIDQLVGDAIKVYEEKHGEIKPTDHRGDASKIFQK